MESEKSGKWKKVFLGLKVLAGYPFASPMKKAFLRFRLTKGEEKRHQYDVGENDIIFDVGGYRGEWSEAFLSKNCRIFIFEPLSAFSGLLSEKFEACRNVKVFPFGLDNRTHTAKISLEENGSSQYHGKGGGVLRTLGLSIF